MIHYHIILKKGAAFSPHSVLKKHKIIMSATSIEVISDIIALKKPKRYPVALLSGGAWTLNQHKLTLENALKEGAERIAEIQVETNEAVKSDIVWAGSGYNNLVVKALGGQIKYRKKGTPDVIAPLLKHPDETEQIDIGRLKEDPDIKILWEITTHLSKKIGDYTLVGAGAWGPFTLAGLFLEAESLMRLVYRDRDALHRVLQFTTDVCYEYYRGYIENGAKIINIGEPTASGDMISRVQFESFAKPYLTQLTKRLKEHGVYVCIHICGNISDRLDLVRDSGADIISVDYKVDLEKASEGLGETVVLAGNMNPVNVVQLGTVDEVIKASTESIQKVKTGLHILMPGCDIPPSVPLENLIAMVKTAHNQL